MNEKTLNQKVAEILVDYAFNSTKIETTEQYVYKIIEKVKKEERQRILNELKKCVGHASFISKIKELENE
jgi:replication initiation and membrane attachment protein DnaB